MSDRILPADRPNLLAKYGISAKLSKVDQDSAIFAAMKLAPAEGKRQSKRKLAPGERLIALNDDAAEDLAGNSGSSESKSNSQLEH